MTTKNNEEFWGADCHGGYITIWAGQKVHSGFWYHLTERPERTFWQPSVYICQNSSDCTLLKSEFIIYIYINYMTIFKNQKFWKLNY